MTYEGDSTHQDDEGNPTYPGHREILRRKYIEGCQTCQSVREVHEGFGPSHDANPQCESGGHTHCSCGVCF